MTRPVIPPPNAVGGYAGPYGIADRVTEPLDATPATLAAWVVTAPTFHPMWSQYGLAVIHLRAEPGLPDPRITVPGATHEIMCVTLDPDHPAALPWRILTPVNIAQQITATDDEAVTLLALAARGIVNGHLEPEASNGPDRIRAVWAATLNHTLDHMRGGAHPAGGA
jgi:hypothetical protein